MFRSEGNHLHFPGATGEDVLPVVAALHNLVRRQGYRDIILDFSKAGFMHPSFMLPLVTTARMYRGEKVDFEIIEPEDPKSSRMLKTQIGHT
jgi:hypothetical protein